jgi:DMSO reductase anchor subunit
MPSLFSSREAGGERAPGAGFFRFVPIASLLLIIAEVALISWRVVPMIYGQTAVPLHYNIHFGVDTIGDWRRIFTVPVIGLLILLINTALARFFLKGERALSAMAAGATLFLEVILFVATIFIILLNISYG